MTNIDTIKVGDEQTEIIGEITQKSEERTFEKFGNIGKVCSAKIKDRTGTIGLTLWNEEINLVKIGDKVKITNGYISEFREQMQVSKGKFGIIQILKESETDTLKEPSGEYIEEDFNTPEELVK